MTRNLTGLRPPRGSRGARCALIATGLLVVLTALGCGATSPTSTTIREAGGALLTPSARGGVFDIDQPTVANLDEDLLEAIQAAARDAREDGVRMNITSGWRSRAHQQRLFAEAVSKYGSEQEASRWVSTPDDSAHVTGDAVDIGPTDAADWLSRHGSAYGLCQIFANEIWHYELATEPGGRCPEMLPDSSSRAHRITVG